MEPNEIRGLSDEEIRKRIEEAHRELFDLRFKWSIRQLVNHREIPKVRKRIARMHTILKEREFGTR